MRSLGKAQPRSLDGHHGGGREGREVWMAGGDGRECLGRCWVKGWRSTGTVRPREEWPLSASPEIKRSFSSLPLYWQWLQKTKFPEYNREGTDGRRAWGLGQRGVWLNCSPVPTPPCLPFQLSAVPPVVSRKGKAVRARGLGSPRRAWLLAGGPGIVQGWSWGFPSPALVPLSPAGGSTILYNCSTCEGFEVLCWPLKRCFPGPHSPPPLASPHPDL